LHGVVPAEADIHTEQQDCMVRYKAERAGFAASAWVPAFAGTTFSGAGTTFPSDPFSLPNIALRMQKSIYLRIDSVISNF
jgi:hypothetical protein